MADIGFHQTCEIGYFFVGSVFKKSKRSMKTLINMVELGGVRRNRLSHTGINERQELIAFRYLFEGELEMDFSLSETSFRVLRSFDDRAQ